MRINEELCVSCGVCIPYCPMNAIREVDGTVAVDQDRCVECRVCMRSGVCPVDAFEQPALQWPRILRALFSDPLTVHPETGVAGRGTEEMKTNDVTGRFTYGEVGFGVEMGRPNTGTTFREVQLATTSLARLGVRFEPKNPVTFLMRDPTTGELRDDILDERVLTAIIEFAVPEERVWEVLDCLKDIAARTQTVFALDIIARVREDGRTPLLDSLRRAGWWLSPNGKVCIGIGKAGSNEVQD